MDFYLLDLQRQYSTVPCKSVKIRCKKTCYFKFKLKINPYRQIILEDTSWNPHDVCY